MRNKKDLVVDDSTKAMERVVKSLGLGDWNEARKEFVRVRGYGGRNASGIFTSFVKAVDNIFTTAVLEGKYYCLRFHFEDIYC